MLLGGPANLTTTKAALLSSHTSGLGWGDKVLGSRFGGWGKVQVWVGSQDNLVIEVCLRPGGARPGLGDGHLVICWMQCAR